MLRRHMASSTRPSRPRDPTSRGRRAAVRSVRLAGWLALALHFGSLGDVFADVAPDNPRAALRTVHVVLVGDAALDPVLGQRIASWFDPGAFRVELELAPRLDAQRILAPAPLYGAEVWVTVRPQGARIYFVRGAKERRTVAYLVRDMQLERGLDEMGAERVGEAIHFSVLALLEGHASSEREEVIHALENDAPKAVESATPPLANPAVAPLPHPEP